MSMIYYADETIVIYVTSPNWKGINRLWQKIKDISGVLMKEAV
jgi:hypothetical protein